MKYVDQAVDNHKHWYSCSASVLCAFADAVSLTEKEAQKKAAPMASGRMDKCGAVLAAECVLEENYGKADAAAQIEAFERAFIARNRSVQCRDLMGSCRRCVANAAEILENMI